MSERRVERSGGVRNTGGTEVSERRGGAGVSERVNAAKITRAASNGKNSN